MGEQWTKVTEWVDGKTRNFSWQISPTDIGGHRSFRMPKQIIHVGMIACLSYDFWIYLDDFVMAESENALPVYE